jgi:hypothetical protein
MRPYLENTQHKKRTSGMVQVAEHLPSKHEAMHSNPNTTKTNKQKRRCRVTFDY